jgi:hypothetical protein
MPLPVTVMPWLGVVDQSMLPSAKARYGTWIGYSGLARPALAAVLLAVAATVLWAGTRLSRPLRATRPGRATTVVMLLVWILSIVTFLVSLGAYVLQLQQEGLAQPTPTDPITPITLTAVVATFVIVTISAPRHGSRRVSSGLISALAAPMIFELPFDLIVMSRTYPPIPPHPALYRLLYFLPLFLVEVTTLWLLTTAPRAAIRPATCRCLAAMFAVFAVWALFGFEFPDAPVLIAFNVAAKVLAFATAVSLFLPPARSEPA